MTQETQNKRHRLRLSNYEELFIVSIGEEGRKKGRGGKIEEREGERGRGGKKGRREGGREKGRREKGRGEEGKGHLRRGDMSYLGWVSLPCNLSSLTRTTSCATAGSST